MHDLCSFLLIYRLHFWNLEGPSQQDAEPYHVPANVMRDNGSRREVETPRVAKHKLPAIDCGELSSSNVFLIHLYLIQDIWRDKDWDEAKNEINC